MDTSDKKLAILLQKFKDSNNSIKSLVHLLSEGECAAGQKVRLLKNLRFSLLDDIHDKQQLLDKVDYVIYKVKRLVKFLAAAVFTAALMGGSNAGMAQDRMTASDAEVQKLFGCQNPIAVKCDKELSDIMQKMIYSDAAERSKLTAKQRELLTLAVLAANGAHEDVGAHAKGALKAGAKPEEVRETLFQCTPYIGIAKAKPALAAMQKAFKDEDVKMPAEGAATVNDETRYADGLAVQKEIFGAEHIDAMHANTPEDLKFTVDFLAANCFGDFYTRKVLDLKQREMITFTALIALGGCEPQVRAHVSANLSVGNTRQDLLNAVTAVLPYIGYPRSLNAVACINAVTK